MSWTLPCGKHIQEMSNSAGDQISKCAAQNCRCILGSLGVTACGDCTEFTTQKLSPHHGHTSGDFSQNQSTWQLASIGRSRKPDCVFACHFVLSSSSLWNGCSYSVTFQNGWPSDSCNLRHREKHPVFLLAGTLMNLRECFDHFIQEWISLDILIVFFTDRNCISHNITNVFE